MCTPLRFCAFLARHEKGFQGGLNPVPVPSNKVKVSRARPCASDHPGVAGAELAARTPSVKTHSVPTCSAHRPPRAPNVRRHPPPPAASATRASYSSIRSG